MKRPFWLTGVLVLSFAPAFAVAQQAPPGVATRRPDTVRFGDLVRIETASAGLQTGRFLEVDPDTVLIALSQGGSSAKIGRSHLQRLELPRGRDLGRGFQRGALVGAAIGAGATAAVAAIILGICEHCGDDDLAPGLLRLGAIFIPPPAVIGGLVGLAGAPPHWQPAVLPPPSLADPGLAAPDLGDLPVRIFASTQPMADSVGRVHERHRAAGVAGGADLTISVDDGHTGPAEVVYFDRDDGDEAAALAFWLGRVLDQAVPPTRLQQNRDVPRRIVAWLAR